jgi:hypothetical protein
MLMSRSENEISLAVWSGRRDAMNVVLQRVQGNATNFVGYMLQFLDEIVANEKKVIIVDYPE